MEKLFNLIVFLPLLSFITISAFGRRLGVYGSMLISCANMVCSLLAAIILFVNQSFINSFYVELWNWVMLVGFPIPFSLRYDALTAVMFLVVGLVSSCVHIYSCVYMYTDLFLSKVFSINVGVLSMPLLLLVSKQDLEKENQVLKRIIELNEDALKNYAETVENYKQHSANLEAIAELKANRARKDADANSAMIKDFITSKWFIIILGGTLTAIAILAH